MIARRTAAVALLVAGCHAPSQLQGPGPADGAAEDDGGAPTGGAHLTDGGARRDGGGKPVDLASSAGDGGSGPLLKFAVFGDSRPGSLGDNSGYPSAIVGGIFSLAQSNGAQFVVGTGDYMYANKQADVTAQIALFDQARAVYTAGPVYLAMGNHECTGFTASNCPALDETPNVKAFVAHLPAGVTSAYYRIDVPTPLGSAKLLFLAANAWDTQQETWLKAELAKPTTYTFVVRHEPSYDPQAPGVTPSETAITASPYTLELNGHSHEYKRLDTQHVVSGNAGAPIAAGSNSNYGLLIVEQQADGNIAVSEIDEASGTATDTWTVSPTGQAM